MKFQMAAALLVLAALATPVLSEHKTRPVMKVIGMLEDMKAELNKELEDDKAVYELLTCWCNTGKQDKTKAIEMANANIDRLTAAMGEAAGKIAELKAKRKETMDEMYADQKGLGEANAQRMKDNQSFHGEETDLLDAISAAKGAIVALSKQNPDLAQVRKVALKLSEARATMKLADSSTLGHVQMNELKSFLQASAGASSFLAIPGMQSYAPQSGQIFGILKQMKEDFEKNLSDSQAAEKKALEEYEMLKAAKEDEIATAQKLVVELDASIAEFTEKHAQAASELEDTQNTLADDTEFLAALEAKCATADAEFSARTKSRNEEVAAVEDTIEYLNSDEAYAVFDKAVNTAAGSNKFSATAFIQISAKAGEKEREQRNQVSALLQRVAGQTSSPQLALVAARAQLDAFTEVKVEIDKMLVELKKQQADEVDKRDWCISELNANERSTTHAYDTKANLEAKIADLTKTIEQLTTDIKTAKDTIAETMTQMKRAGETREIENADYQTVVSDQIITQAILTKALDRMKAVYALLQGPATHTQTSATRTDPGNGPAKFDNYEQNAGGKRVVAMIQEVINDSKKTEDEAHASEADSQAGYEYFVKESNKSITQLTTSINDMTVSLAKAKEDLTMAKADFAGTMKELEGLNDYVGDLHKSCDYVLKNFDARQAARAAEMDALNEAKQILSGAQ